MATSTFVGLTGYLKTSYEPDCEWRDGELKERPGGTGTHSPVQTFFLKFLGSHERPKSQGVVSYSSRPGRAISSRMASFGLLSACRMRCICSAMGISTS